MKRALINPTRLRILEVIDPAERDDFPVAAPLQFINVPDECSREWQVTIDGAGISVSAPALVEIGRYKRQMKRLLEDSYNRELAVGVTYNSVRYQCGETSQQRLAGVKESRRSAVALGLTPDATVAWRDASNTMRALDDAGLDGLAVAMADRVNALLQALFTGKDAIEAATDHAAVDAAVAAVTWPAGA